MSKYYPQYGELEWCDSHKTFDCEKTHFELSWFERKEGEPVSRVCENKRMCCQETKLRACEPKICVIL